MMYTKTKEKKVHSGSTFCYVERFIQTNLNSSIICHDRHVNHNYFQKKVSSIVFKLVWFLAGINFEKTFIQEKMLCLRKC